MSSLDSHLPHQRSNAGFALIASLSIMAILVLIAVALYSLSSVATKSAEIAAARTEAQASAKMALMIAIGELQAHLGPDQRISARSLTLGQHPNFDTAVDLEPDSSKAWWTGVSSTQKEDEEDDENDEIEELKNGKPVVWLLTGLDPDASSKEQLEGGIFPTLRKIPMFGANSIDLNLTGGESIEAGAVPIFGNNNTAASGSYAYFIDDNGMKAQLVASNPSLRNDDSSAGRLGGTTIPGSYDLSILTGMDSFTGTDVADFLKLNNLNELPLIGGAPDIAKEKRLSYTTRSYGVLADVKNGGLKKDLTIAFENYEIDPEQAYHPEGGEYLNWPVYPVFEEVFEKTSDSEWEKYLAVDESRWSEFGANGYIHWGIFRDYYNMKRYIKRQNGFNEEGNSESMDYLDPITYEGPISTLGGNKPYANGVLAPHDIGPDSSDPALSPGGDYENMPYGDFRTRPNKNLRYEKEFLQYYKHSPISLILTRIQTNAWVEQGQIDRGYRNEADLTNIVDALRTKAQTFSTHYNPYNITMRCYGDNKNLMLTGGTPFAKLAFDDGAIPFAPYDRAFRFSGANVESDPPYEVITANTGSFEGRRYTANGYLMIGPGRSRIGGFGVDERAGNSSGSGTFTLNIADNLDKAIYTDYNLVDTIPTSFNVTGRFEATQAMGHGVQDRESQDVTQWMWVPFAQINSSTGGSGITIEAPGSGLGPDSSRTGIALELRTTMDENDSVRALIDANIRGFYFNPRWDSPLLEDAPLDTSAAYKLTKLEDLDNSQAPQMVPTRNEDGDLVGGLGYWGNDHDSFGSSRVILFDIPRKDLVSLGQLQHAGAGRFSYEPSYIVGNSYANPRIPLDAWETTFADTFSPGRSGVPSTLGPITLYDASYLVNETLWDSYIFTTIPQNADNYDPDNLENEPEPDAAHFAQLLARDAALPNPRFIPYVPEGSNFDTDTLQRVGDEDNISAFYYNAGHLLVDGAFNVNSTSIDAWEAFLSGTYGMPYGKVDETGKLISGLEPLEEAIRFPRVENVYGEPFETGSPSDEGFWTGFRELTPDEIRDLAAAIVDEVIERGPFLSLGDFVNRKLETGDLGAKGALQAALDNTVNNSPSTAYSLQATHPNPSVTGENLAAGFSGMLLQGDILQALSPFMSTRSDTFTIRAYGDSISPNNNEIIAKAWCEAVVQRLPDPVEIDTSISTYENLAQPAGSFGRKFKVISFRWLDESEI